ncbi:MAG: dihydroorotate dehydrogenase [Candidatus Omnitrophica bacterium]|nr:dihydroorotate dehydrogenase [Candidatus Omnitrophota bacterium]
MNPNLEIKIGKMKLSNPVMVASGTFGYGEEFADFMDLKKLGAIVSKTITLNPRQGNPAPRTCETPCGMLNSIGLENFGVERFIKEKLPLLKKIGIPVIVSIASEKEPDEFIKLAKRLSGLSAVSAIELNISCPNIKGARGKGQGVGLIAQDAKATYEVVRAVRKTTDKILIVKLTPNVTSIGEIALRAAEAGADALSLINTLNGMSIDVQTRKPKIAMVTAGLSGPAIRPVAVKMVWEVHNKVKIPIIGMGGIIDTNSALEFLIVGASAISIGTANFINPKTSIEIIEGIKNYMKVNKISDIKDLTGSLQA